MKAIIVEDEVLAAVCAEAALERLGVEVVGTAEDCASALELIESKPQLALVDLNLRDGFTGPYLGERLNAAGIKVVFVTANTGLLSERNAMRSPVLEKPLEQSVLANVLQPIMDQVHG